MRDEAYTRWLEACEYTPKSVRSRLSRCRTIESRLRVDLDQFDLSNEGVERLRSLLTSVESNGPILANLLNAARTYGRFRANQASLVAVRRAIVRSSSSPPPEPRPESLTKADVGELMELYGEILDELRSRRVIRSANAPQGDYAEYLFAKAFGWELSGKSMAHHDAIGPGGVRYQIKGCRESGRAGGRQLGIIRNLPQRKFDILAAVLFDRKMRVSRAALIPHPIVEERARFIGHVNGWRFMLSDEVWTLPDVRDVTEELRSV